MPTEPQGETPTDEGEIRESDFAFVYLDVDDPHIAWLAYRGLLNSCDITTTNPGSISWFFVDVIKRGLISTLRREGALEGYRLREFPDLPSRLRCVYAYPDLNAATKGNYGRGKFRKENLVAISPAADGFRVSSHDSNWINDFDSLPIETARKYWRGEKTKYPHFECLLNGRFRVLGTTVRKRAYETVKRTWPNALAMLELSRLAVEFGSDLGSTSPWLMREGDEVFVRHIIRYDEQEGLNIFRQTLEKAKREPTFQVNWADLEPLCRPTDDFDANAKFAKPDSRAYDHLLRQDKVAALNEYVQLVSQQPSANIIRPRAASVHNLPETPAFRDERPDSPISEFALRVVVEFEGWQLYVIGTATLVAGHVAITARHVLDYAVRTFGAKKNSDMEVEVDGYALRLYQVLPGPIYRIWNVHTAWPCSSDIAVLHLGLWRTTIPDEKIEWKQPRLRVLPPPVGQKVVAFGYRESKVMVTESSDGTHHIELNDRPTTSIGTIRQVYPAGRDRVMLPFPCFEVEARFDPGMSGGMVLDESGSLCGLICATLQNSDLTAPPVSYVAALWPMLTTAIAIDRGDKYPRGITYPMIDLAIDGLISVVDLHELDQRHFPGKKLNAQR